MELRHVKVGDNLDIKYLVEVCIEAERLGLDVVSILPESCRGGHIPAKVVNRIIDYVVQHQPYGTRMDG